MIGAPGILRGDFRVVRSSDNDMVREVEREFDQDVTYFQRELDNMYECWGAYFAMNGSSWEAKTLRSMQERGLTAMSFNLLGQKVNTLAGAIVSDMPDSDWLPLDGERTQNTEAVRERYYQDKEQMNWDAAMIETIRDGLVKCGWVRMGVSRKLDPLGSIYLQRIMPGMLIPARNWKTGDDTDLMRATCIGYYTAEGLAHKYPKRQGAIQEEILRQQRNASPMPGNASELRQRYARKVGEEFMVIESHWIELVRKKRLIGQRFGTDAWIPFPIELGDDQAKNVAFADAYGIDLSSAVVEPYEDQIHHVTAICPGFSQTLVCEDGVAEEQPKRLPFFHFTVMQHDGMTKGTVGEMLDMQRVVDQRLQYEHEAVSKANGGARLVNKHLFPSEDEWDKYVANKNKLGTDIPADIDAVKTPFINLSPEASLGNVNANLTTIMQAFLPTLSRVSEAMNAQSQPGESAILFERQYQINRIGNLLMDKDVKQLVNNIGEAYYYQYQVTYGDGQPRQIRCRNGGTITINDRMPMGVNPDGTFQWGLVNDPRYLPRLRVVVTESQRSGTHQIYRRHLLSDSLAMLMKAPEANMAKIAAFFQAFIETGDYGEKLKTAVEQAAQVDTARMMMQLYKDLSVMGAQQKQANAQSLQFDMQGRQMLAQLQAYMNQMVAPQMAGDLGGNIPVDVISPERANAPLPVQQRMQGDVPTGQLPPPPPRNPESAPVMA